MAAELSHLSPILSSEEEKILACVHCGLCLEACPTYVATGDENDSPRGRIYLMRAVKEERLAVTSLTFENHIDRCLGCRACESACPAGVEYGQLLEAARAEIARGQTKPTGTYRLLYFVLKHVWSRPKRLRGAFTLARWFRDSRVPNLLLRTGMAREVSSRFEFALALLEGSRVSTRNGPRSPRGQPLLGGGSDQVRNAAKMDAGTPALLFKGCVTEGLFKRVNEATARVLEVNRCKVQAPEAQVCCGALHAHAGDIEGARALARQNIEAFENKDTPIITNAGGCGAMLASYGHLLEHDAKYAAPAREFSARVRDVGQHLQAIGFRNGESVGFARTTYDASCHLLHGQHAADASLQMLWAIPNLNFTLLSGSDVCCGGAGVYNLLEPELSEQVLDEKIRNVEQSGATVLATGNPGCHMQIAAGARLAGNPLQVCHPVELLDESYNRAGFYDGKS
ncbi:MAG TPA: heterodisulfide reductase-related iron-sulfur binding cluster [Pyrinomonadaceae bacterium]|nr:heterodisulfide reductase-related iron-sulfur binding cluster [Pyrinomonadaceae bacterium]